MKNHHNIIDTGFLLNVVVCSKNTEYYINNLTFNAYECVDGPKKAQRSWTWIIFLATEVHIKDIGIVQPLSQRHMTNETEFQ